MSQKKHKKNVYKPIYKKNHNFTYLYIGFIYIFFIYTYLYIKLFRPVFHRFFITQKNGKKKY